MVSKKQSSAIIAADVMRFGHVINKDGVFGTHTPSCASSMVMNDQPQYLVS